MSNYNIEDLPKSVRETIGLMQTNGEYVDDNTITLLLRVNSGDITADEAIEEAYQEVISKPSFQ